LARSETLTLTGVDRAELGIDDLAWDKQDGLLPAIVQDARTLRVLMLGCVNREALRLTLDTRKATFFSRSRARLWSKGETSGNALDVVGINCDCDRDTLLLNVEPRGPTCHLGTQSCFAEAGSSPFGELDAIVAQRQRERPAGSYTASLFESGVARIAQKVGEEGVEVALAAVTSDDAQLLGEAADLIYHLAVLLRARGLMLRDVAAALGRRQRKPASPPGCV
jgi:phosphoribosyl-ATP pyrophosphohydrolase/phosphoribosyl-AMP cyclohydrolase